jgi:hypothetical protein
MKMTRLACSIVIAFAAVVWLEPASVARAQDGAAAASAPRRIFNPFARFSLRRFSFNNLGLLQVGPAGGSGPVASSASTASDDPPLAAAIRPPYRPPTRSPFRPPPRPPF